MRRFGLFSFNVVLGVVIATAFAWADLDGDADPDAGLIDASGRLLSLMHAPRRFGLRDGRLDIIPDRAQNLGEAAIEASLAAVARSVRRYPAHRRVRRVCWFEWTAQAQDVLSARSGRA